MKAKEDMLRRKHETQTVISKKKSRVPGPRSGAASLKLLIDEAILSPGIGVLSLEYRGIKEIANLCSDGRIQWKGTQKYQGHPSLNSMEMQLCIVLRPAQGFTPQKKF